MTELTEIVSIISIFVSIGMFFIGYWVAEKKTKKSDKERREDIVNAFNIERELTGNTKDDPVLFIEDDKIMGKKTVSASLQIRCNIVSLEKKKRYTEDGTVDLSDEEVAELRKLPQFRKTAI